MGIIGQGVTGDHAPSVLLADTGSGRARAARTHKSANIPILLVRWAPLLRTENPLFRIAN